jgi:hypothetical protein
MQRAIPDVLENKGLFYILSFPLRPIMGESKKGKENGYCFPIKDRVQLTDNGSSTYLLMGKLYA